MTTEHKRESTPHKARGKERRTGSQDMVQKLIAERTEMLSLYCQMAGLEPYGNGKNSRGKTAQELLQKFCQDPYVIINGQHSSVKKALEKALSKKRSN